ncbi:MAG: phytanoyl-CoA dioxygenase family protein [Candidatus Sumerlaeaceae bacterium]
MISTDCQLDNYRRDGYLVVPDLITPGEIERLRRDSADLARGRYPSESLKPLPESMSDDEVQRRILCIHMPHHLSPVITEFIKHPAIVEVLTQIIGPDVKCMQSMLFVKPPGFQGQAWHQDEIYIPTRDRSLCGAWIAMDDATQENGCLWVIPGSHEKGYLYPQKQHDNPDEFDSAQESFGFDDSAAVPVEVRAGAVVFFNGYLLHRSLRNRSSNDYRRALVSHYMNAYSLLPWELKEGERVAIADRRSIILVAGTDPYAWKGYEQPGMEIYLRVCKANEDLMGR